MTLFAAETFWDSVPPPVVGGIIGAVVGLIGVFLGQKIIHERERRKTALDLFMRTTEDVRAFRDSQMAWFHLDNQAVRYLSEEPPHYHEARRRVASAKARIESTRFGIELMFGRKARRLTEALTMLCKPEYKLADLKVLDKHIEEVEQEIRPLWKSLDADSVGGCCGEDCDNS